MITQNDFKILQSILDKDDKGKGIIKTNGTTKKEIIQKTGMSITKVTNTLTNFQNQGLIGHGLMVKNAKSYIVTEKGQKELLELKGMNVE
jgi:DNA-binding PadR family transcriptional regulator